MSTVLDDLPVTTVNGISVLLFEFSKQARGNQILLLIIWPYD